MHTRPELTITPLRREADLAHVAGFTETPAATQEVIRISQQIRDRRKAQIALPPSVKDRRFSGERVSAFGALS